MLIAQLEDLYCLLGNEGENFIDFADRMRVLFD